MTRPPVLLRVKPILYTIVSAALSSFQSQNFKVFATSENEFIFSNRNDENCVASSLATMLETDAVKATTNDPFTRETQRETIKETVPNLLVFSDVDGTLVHYPESIDLQDVSSQDHNIDNDLLLKLPPSRTGLQGVISYETLRKCQILRRNYGIKLVLVSGMRTSTMMQRLPFLPKADAYCCENGGRIFYPVDADDNELHQGRVFRCINNEALSESNRDGDCRPFVLVEDLDWRSFLERTEAAGPDGYRDASDENDSPIIPIEQRQGLLWEFAKSLLAAGYVLDWQGYATCFRVNRKQQTIQITDDLFQALASSNEPLYCPPGLIRSTNLGHIDFAPSCSGKRNCCRYLANKFMKDHGSNKKDRDRNIDWLASAAVCWCDDDNDLDMALACRHVFVPSVSSASMAAVIQTYPDHFTVTGGATDRESGFGTKGTELAIDRTLELIQASKAAMATLSGNLRP